MQGALPVFCFSDRNGIDRLVVEEPISWERGGDRHEVAREIVEAMPQPVADARSLPRGLS